MFYELQREPSNGLPVRVNPQIPQSDWVTMIEYRRDVDSEPGKSVLHPFCRSIDSAWPTTDWQHSHTLLAVSGGADSVALLRAMVQLNLAGRGAGRLYAAHFNHQVRSDADRDEQWVANLCKSLDLPLETGRAKSALSATAADGLEAAARDARYQFLRTTAERLGARYLVTAHSADDQAETVLHHVLRGTGLAGLAGMRAARPLSASVVLVRPMLGLWRRDILDFLAYLRQDFCTDCTNADLSFTRNRLRQDLLPKLRSEYNPAADEALVRLARQAREAHDLISAAVESLFGDCVQMNESPRRITIEGKSLESHPEIVSRELCKRAWVTADWPEQSMGFDQWRLLAEMLRPGCQTSVVILPGGVRAESVNGRLTLLRAG